MISQHGSAKEADQKVRLKELLTIHNHVDPCQRGPDTNKKPNMPPSNHIELKPLENGDFDIITLELAGLSQLALFHLNG